MLYISLFTLNGDGVQADRRTFGTGFKCIFIQTIRLLNIRPIIVVKDDEEEKTNDEFKDIII
jgi:hypothetical protein